METWRLPIWFLALVLLLGGGPAIAAPSGLRLHAGNLTREQVEKTLEGTRPALLRCQLAGLVHARGFRASLPIHYTITASGAVRSDLRLGTSSGQPEVDACVLAVFRGLRFPAPLGGWTVGVEHRVELPALDLDDQELLYRGYQLELRRAGWLSACWSGIGDSQIDLPGRIDLVVTVSARSTVSKIVLERSSLNHLRFERCFLEAVRRVTFPNLSGDPVELRIQQRFVPERPSLEQGVTVWGDVEKASVRRVLARKSYQLRSCGAVADGTRIQLSIGRTGEVIGVRVKGPQIVAGLSSCLVRSVKGWRFPRSDQGLSIVVFPAAGPV